ncbi:phosphodiesterase [Mycobacterium sp. MYCO198283]|uniref:phosphodiesterase n=1 Tax=Mycobacterium sp. MYCO198283 TaxID=2883505 RepID=UPI001E433F83|nr:phosphodiesterase [Mycobacterium sp. MYCO198283]MCG5432834.1 phosphodiesterase [Mycobacterium sp. MYCO198283]
MKASDLAALPLQVGSAVRHRRVFHPIGVLARGRLERTAPPGVGLPVESTDVVARVSKGAGVPGALPDVIGLAVKMPPQAFAATAWDLLLVSAGSGLLTRFALRPTLTWGGTAMTTLMPLRYEDAWWWVQARLTTELEGGLSIDAVSEAIANGGVTFELSQARGTGGFEPLATLTLTEVVPTDEQHDVNFDPTRNSAPNVKLGPEWLTRLRERAYWRSRKGRHAPGANPE